MSRFSEDTFKHWHRPASETEEKEISNAITMIKDGIRKHATLSKLDIDVFVQGSYGNNTNVRRNSDIDVCVMLRDTFYSKYPKGKTKEDYGFSSGTYVFSLFRKWVINAMEVKFGSTNVNAGNKSIKIDSNSYHVQADVVPAFQYRNYSNDKNTNPENFAEGVQFFSNQGDTVINYPKIHIANGKTKNSNTGRKFKRLVRIFKRVKVQMIDEGKSVNDSISSFLISGLIWNVPNRIFNDNDTWQETVKEAIRFLYHATKTEAGCRDWGEVSEKFYLFGTSRKWTRTQVNDYLRDMWNFLEFK